MPTKSQRRAKQLVQSARHFSTNAKGDLHRFPKGHMLRKMAASDTRKARKRIMRGGGFPRGFKGM